VWLSIIWCARRRAAIDRGELDGGTRYWKINPAIKLASFDSQCAGVFLSQVTSSAAQRAFSSASMFPVRCTVQ
jgi:hypothetical protein